MQKNNRKRWSFIINAFCIIALFILRYSSLLTLKIGQASPITLIPFVIAVSIFWGSGYGAVAGFFSGVLMDGVLTDSSCFNTIALMFLGALCGVLSSHYLNKNIKSAICLSLGGVFAYLFLKLTIFYSFKEISIGAEYFASYFIPTIFYTALFIIPFYFLERKLSNI